MKIALLLRSLHRGGCEQQALLLARELSQRGHQVKVAVFYRQGDLVPEMEASGAELAGLDKKGRWDWLGPGLRLRRWLSSWRPDALYSLLYEPNLAALACSRGLGLRLVWGLRTSNMDPLLNEKFLRLIFTLGRFASPLAQTVIYNSQAGRDYHLQKGYCRSNALVVPNGFDLARFRFDPQARQRLREQWKIGPEEFLIGMVGRLDPIKDHHGFLQAAARFKAGHPRARFVFVGGGDPGYRKNLEQEAAALELGQSLVWAGEQREMPAVYSAMDINTSASLSEGFSNVIGEAMACGTPCVVTEVGDSALMVGGQGITIAPGDPGALARAWQEMSARLDGQGDGLREAVRRRMAEKFSTQHMVERTLEILKGRPSSD